MSSHQKRYSDREVALIIQTALDIEGRQGPGEAGGLLMAEIEDIARQTGISVEHVRLAVEKIAAPKTNSLARRLIGSETTFTSSEFVPRALTRAELESLEAALPALTSLSEAGVVSGGALTWKRSIAKSLMDGFPLRLSVQAVQGGTRITARATLHSMAAVLFAASGGLGVTVGIKLSLAVVLLAGIGTAGLPVVAALIAGGGLAGLGLAWFLARRAFRSLVRRSREKTAVLVGRIRQSIPPAEQR